MTSEPDGGAWGPAIDGMDDDLDSQSPDSNTTTDSTRPERLQWLRPDDSDSDHDGRTGVLSTYVEWHALVIGLALGTIAVQTGNVEIIAAVIGAGAAGSRAQGGLPEKYLQQAKSELPYFVFGAGVAVIVGVLELGNLVGV